MWNSLRKAGNLRQLVVRQRHLIICILSFQLTPMLPQTLSQTIFMRFCGHHKATWPR